MERETIICLHCGSQNIKRNSPRIGYFECECGCYWHIKHEEELAKCIEYYENNKPEKIIVTPISLVSESGKKIHLAPIEIDYSKKTIRSI